MDATESEKEFDRDLKSRQYVCPICHKEFTLPMFVSKSGYVYTISVYDKETKKNKNMKCCSYSCYRKGSKD